MRALALRPADLREFDGQARVKDLRISEALGFERPRKIRELIQRNLHRLERHGLICSTVGQIKSDAANPRGAGRRPTEYWLNEHQAYRLCMWSDAPNADAVQEKMVEVFVAWRHGKLQPSAGGDRMAALLSLQATRLEALGRAADMCGVREHEHLATGLAHLPMSGVRRYPKFWSDVEIRERALTYHRQMTLREALERMQAEIGRSPSASALHRFWIKLDRQVGRQINGEAA